MRSAILLSLLLCVAAVLAVKDDVACVVHSDDCGSCVSNGCNWCSDGYCVSKESDICEAHKVATECGVQPIVQQRQRGQRQAVVCEAINTCSACAAAPSCRVCVDPVTHVPKCSGSATCDVDPYNVQWEWWIPRAGLNTADFGVNTCPVKKPAASNSPTLVIKFKVFVVQPGGSVPEGLFTGSLINYIARFFGAGKVTEEHVLVQSYTLNPPANKRQTLDQSDRDATVYVKFADGADFTAQGLAATILNGYTDNTVALAPGSAPITVNPYTPTVGAGSVVNRGGNGNSGVDLSKGALAGIIIGCVIGGALIIALIAFLILRRRDAYPQAFRSPAAAYRP